MQVLAPKSGLVITFGPGLEAKVCTGPYIVIDLGLHLGTQTVSHLADGGAGGIDEF